jgi:hypothetical protein
MAKDYNFFKRDDNRVTIPTGTGFETQDATGTPQKSPLTVSSSVITIAIPTDAAEMVVSVDQDCRLSEEATAADRYYVIKANTAEVIGCSNIDTLYLLRNAATDVALNFRFVLV